MTRFIVVFGLAATVVLNLAVFNFIRNQDEISEMTFQYKLIEKISTQESVKHLMGQPDKVIQAAPYKTQELYWGTIYLSSDISQIKSEWLYTRGGMGTIPKTWCFAFNEKNQVISKQSYE